MKTNKHISEVNRLKKIAGILKEDDIDLSDTPKFQKFDYKKISNIEFDGIDYNDYPDFADAYIVSADYDGVPMSPDEIDELNQDPAFVHDELMDYLY